MKNNKSKSAQPKRILQYIGSLATGGSQSMIMGVYRNIDRTKFQFDFVVDKPKDIRYKEEIEKLGGKIYFLPPYRVYNGIAFRHAWKKLFKEHPEYKVIHSHVRTTAAMVFKIAKKNGLKTVAHSHSTSNGDGLKGKIKDLYQMQLTKYSDINLACSEKAGRYLFIGNRFTVINNGIDFEEYAYDEQKRKIARKKLGLLDGDFVICQIGRLTDVKNQIFSVKLLGELITKKLNTKLLIVGNGPDREKIFDYIENNKLTKSAIMLGDRSDISDILSASDVFVMPSLYEGLPFALVEAQASGLPCLISENVKDGIFNNSVTILPLNDMKRWVKLISEYCQKTKVVDRKKIGQNDFDILVTVRQLEKLYGD